MLLKANLLLLNNARTNLNGLCLQLGLDPIPPPINIAAFDGLNDNQICQIFSETREAAIRVLNASNGTLPNTPFPEIHPYKQLYPVNPLYSKYFIGTCPPISYVLDSPAVNQELTGLIPPVGNNINRPKVPFYHGNRNCSQWRVLDDGLIPHIIDIHNRHIIRQNIIAYLQGNETNYFDIIDQWQRTGYNANDGALKNILINTEGLNSVLNQREKPLLIFNSSSTFCQTGLRFNHHGFNPGTNAFDLFIECLYQLGRHVEFCFSEIAGEFIILNQANAHLSICKLIFHIRINGKECLIIGAPSPSPLGANYLTNPIYINYISDHFAVQRGTYPAAIPGFKHYIYRCAIAGNTDSFWALNSD